MVMIIYVVKVMYNDHSNDEASETGISWQQVGAYANLDKAVDSVERWVEYRLGSSGNKIAFTANEIAIAAKVTMDLIDYIVTDDVTHSIKIEKMEVIE